MRKSGSKLYSGDIFNAPEMEKLANDLVDNLNEISFIISDLKNVPAVIKTSSEIRDVNQAFDDLIAVFDEDRDQLDGNSILDFHTVKHEIFF